MQNSQVRQNKSATNNSLISLICFFPHFEQITSLINFISFPLPKTNHSLLPHTKVILPPSSVTSAIPFLIFYILLKLWPKDNRGKNVYFGLKSFILRGKRGGVEEDLEKAYNPR
ncbi:MAG: hypothetical protein A2Z51_06630 [Deltaproteobacteria bacterium RBG_19FT_COMBO_52_11]|nr:MAG: hypothetical protein A2Z51_06630 [Deltaproteobacteria bacterium RBG_19FT_COMBO_52_11]